MSSLTLLGTGTCQIEHERRASSVLLELDGLPILFDCGHGTIQRLLEARIRHNQLEHVVLSHFCKWKVSLADPAKLTFRFIMAKLSFHLSAK